VNQGTIFRVAEKNLPKNPARHSKTASVIERYLKPLKDKTSLENKGILFIIQQ